MPAAEREAVWLGLRLARGIERAAHQALFGRDPVVGREGLLDELVAAGLIEVSPTRLRLTRRGRLAADAVAGKFL